MNETEQNGLRFWDEGELVGPDLEQDSVSPDLDVLKEVSS